MAISHWFTRALSATLLTLALGAGAAHADDIDVMNSGGFSAAYKALQPKFEAATGWVFRTNVTSDSGIVTSHSGAT